MKRSDSFVNIMTAIANAKMQMRSLKKNSKNPHFKSEYADINEVFDVLKDPLYDNGVALAQFPDIVDGEFVLTTLLSHKESGEYIQTDYRLILEKNNSQGQGSAMTYAKRQALSAIFSLHEFDDDGNAAASAEGIEVNDNKDKKQLTSSNLPQPTVKSLMQKYATLYKVSDAGRNSICLRIYHEASKLPPEDADWFIGAEFKEAFGEKKTT